MTFSHSGSQLQLRYLKAHVSKFEIAAVPSAVSAYADFLLNSADSNSCLILQVMFVLENKLLHFPRPSKHGIFLSIIKIPFPG